MTSTSVYVSTPEVRIAGGLATDLMRDLVQLTVEEHITGLTALEARLVSWGPVGGGAGYKHLDRSTVEFGKPVTVGFGASSVTVFRGTISALQADFPASAVSTLTFSAEDALWDLRMKRQTRTFDESSTSDIASQLLRLQDLVEQARAGEAWRALGFESWPAYVLDVLEPIRLPKPRRREVVGWLTGQGMSSRAIATVVDVDQKTVVNDRRAIATSSTGEETSSAAAVAGLDGKAYPARRALVALPSTPPHAPVEDPRADVDERLVLPVGPIARDALLDTLRTAILQTGRATAEDWAQGLVAAERPYRRAAR